MILSLSGRQFEVPGGISKTAEEFIAFASEVGFKGVELRGGHINAGMSDDEALKVKDSLLRHGIRCAFVGGGDPVDDASAAEFNRVTDLAVLIGAAFVRCGGRSIDFARRYRAAAEYAADRGVGIISQLHNGTAFANIELALQCLEAINHENYGVAFEANHLRFDGQEEHGEKAVKAIGDHIFSVSVQNYKLWTAPTKEPKVRINDQDWMPCLPGDPDGVDFASVFRGLRSIGFEGFVTCMPGAHVDLTPEELARKYFEFFAPLVAVS